MIKGYRQSITTAKPSRLVLLLVLGMLILVGISVVKTITQAQALQQDLANILPQSQIEFLAQHLSSLKQRWQQQQLLAEKVMIKIPQDENLPGLLCELTNLADNYDIIITELTVIPPSEVKEYTDGRQINLDLSIKGTYDSIKVFLVSLQDTKRFFAIEAIDLAQIPQTINYGTKVKASETTYWTAHIKLTAFFLSPLNEHNNLKN